MGVFLQFFALNHEEPYANLVFTTYAIDDKFKVEHGKPFVTN